MHKLTRLLLGLLLISCGMSEHSLESPDGQLRVTCTDGSFVVAHKEGGTYAEVLRIEQVGLELGLGTDSYTLVSSTAPILVIDDYEMLSGKRKHCHNRANECVYHFENAEGQPLHLIVRAYDDGVALRYYLPQVDGELVITGEHTAFSFASGIKRWTQPYAVGYEDFYHPNTDGKARNRSHRWNMPALFQPTASTYVLLAEANVLRNQCGAYLSNAEEASTYRVELFDDRFACTEGWYSPWRLAIVGSLAKVVESTLVTDVSAPCQLEDTSWIKPGVASWVYWAYNQGSRDYQIVKQYIDFADTLDLPYVLIDAEWDVMAGGGTLPDALVYSRSKGVDPMIWYNSSTAWISGPGPGYRLNDSEKRDRELAWAHEMGVKGIKVDFFGADSIGMINYYLDILDAAAKHKLMVNFHGATIPRGWQRTYPHFMSSEAVYGAEWYNNNARLTPNAAWHNCTLPFTRNVIGSMDYTPCAFTDSQHPHITSDAHELALTIVFESALQHLADRPSGFLSQPTEVQHLISTLPAAWDDTKLLAGYPGESVAIARQSGDIWYVGVLNGKDEPQSLDIDWSAIGEDIWDITTFADQGETKAWDIRTETLSTKQLPVTINMQPRGGFVAVMKAKHKL